MYQDKDTGLYHFQGGEPEDAMRWLWSNLLDISFWGRVELTWRIWGKKPPEWVGYKSPNYFRARSLEILNKMSGKLCKQCHSQLRILKEAPNDHTQR